MLWQYTTSPQHSMMIALKLPLLITGQAVISTLLVHQSLKILCQDQLTRLEIHVNIIIPYVKQRHVVSLFSGIVVCLCLTLNLLNTQLPSMLTYSSPPHVLLSQCYFIKFTMNIDIWGKILPILSWAARYSNITPPHLINTVYIHHRHIIT